MKFNRDLEVRVMAQQENPIVFISYSQDSLSFADQVLSFANKLRREGIDAILDQYEEAPSEGWPRWMENSINRADYVIVIGSKGYYDKIYGNVELGKGRGVKGEGNLIYQKLYMSDTMNTNIFRLFLMRATCRNKKDRLLYWEGDAEMTDYYKSSAEEMLWELSTSPTGLTSRQAQARQGKYEINKLKEAEKPGFLKHFFLQLKDQMLLILLAAAVVSTLTGGIRSI